MNELIYYLFQKKEKFLQAIVFSGYCKSDYIQEDLRIEEYNRFGEVEVLFRDDEMTVERY